jgi:D-sedoheptulose 7-phosphate isomerase
MINKLSHSLQEHQDVMALLPNLFPTVEAIVAAFIQTLNAGGKIFWLGNGGSAADAQHLAAELIGRYKQERRALPSLALSTDTSVLTSLSNDYDYSVIFSRQLEALCSPNDIVVGLSTSGNSKNVLAGMVTAKACGALTVGFAGQTGQLAQQVDFAISIPSKNTARIQEAHIFIGHMICELVEQIVFESENE